MRELLSIAGLLLGWFLLQRVLAEVFGFRG
jgi:hypothetical protein